MHDHEGNFTRGLMGQIARNETDIALYPFLVTKQRSKIVDFTAGVEGTYVRYLVIWPHIDYKYLFFLPFAWDVSNSEVSTCYEFFLLGNALRDSY